MLTSRIYKHHPDERIIQVSTKRIQINDTSTLYFQIFAEQSAVIALLESQIVELCTDYQLRKENEDVFFSKLLAGLNRLIYSQSNTFSKSGLRAFLGVVRGPELLFSVCGNYQAYLQQEGHIVNIADGMGSSEMEFSYVSNGSILPGSSLFVCNRDLLAFLTKEDLEEFGHDHDPEIIENLISREAPEEVVDCLFFFYEDKMVASDPLKRYQRSGPSFFDSVQEVVGSGYSSLSSAVAGWALKERYQSAIKHPKIQALAKRKEVRIGTFAIGIIVSIGLLILIVQSIFQTSMVTAVPEEYKTKLIEAEQIIGKSTRDMANQELFKENISKAEALVFEVRDKKMFANDVKNLLDKISVLKRQLNGIESISLDTKTLDYTLPDGTLPVALLENAKKNFVVSSNGVYGPFIKGAEPKFAALPDNEITKSADITTEGAIYILTTNDKIIRYNKGEFVYINVEGQTTWEKSSAIKAFIGNIYLLSEDGLQINKHRPGVVGFSAKMPMIEGSLMGKNLIDFTIDGGFYVLQSDLTLEKYITAPAFVKSGVLLNKLPDNYRLAGDSPTKIYTVSSSNFVYMIIDGKVWIFEPDSKTFKNIRAVKYVGQIEITGLPISSILAPKDGEITALTPKGISTIKFEVSDSKIILR